MFFETTHMKEQQKQQGFPLKYRTRFEWTHSLPHEQKRKGRWDSIRESHHNYFSKETPHTISKKTQRTKRERKWKVWSRKGQYLPLPLSVAVFAMLIVAIISERKRVRPRRRIIAVLKRRRSVGHDDLPQQLDPAPNPQVAPLRWLWRSPATTWPGSKPSSA